MALLHVAARLASKFLFRVIAHGVDHGLRPEASAELDIAERFAQEHGVRFGRSFVNLPRGGNLQARARDLRYEALREAAVSAGACAIATAHHADDRAETFLLRLLRGASLRGLAVLPPRAPLRDSSVWLMRPLLRARRVDIAEHIRRHAVPFAEDPSNRELRFLRTRVRHEILPLLEALDPNIVGHIESLADQIDDLNGGKPLGLPKTTENALAMLLSQERKTRRPTMSVWLPGGLVVRAGESEAKKIDLPRANPPLDDRHRT